MDSASNEAMFYSAHKHAFFARAKSSQNEPKSKDNYTAWDTGTPALSLEILTAPLAL